ncbi:MAG TPA: DoxX family protein [Nocardioides sp.]|uniref:DoxX family protein n=1 Tax=uncultured Nocardioides sp. TaxID=198441 RepID=UPI002627D489|nr:DoxX family protein [uncultured Nocardioides sp.]HRI94018.1 DoxX family protein [Nocardioides sp.]HRK44074.1 DoxX family protein [Nocardioides sp.]
MNGIEVSTPDIVLLLFRTTLGVMIIAHGYNHLFGVGGVDGTARWFESLGFRPARVHALMSGILELAVGVGLILGLLTALACAGLIGTMAVAGWVAHRPNGFFIFRDGYEYVLVVAVAALTLAALGPGTVSADAVLGVVDYGSWQSSGLIGLVAVIVAGFGGLIGAVVLLGTGWRPARRSDG